MKRDLNKSQKKKELIIELRFSKYSCYSAALFCFFFKSSPKDMFIDIQIEEGERGGGRKRGREEERETGREREKKTLM